MEIEIIKQYTSMGDFSKTRAQEFPQRKLRFVKVSMTRVRIESGSNLLYEIDISDLKRIAQEL